MKEVTDKETLDILNTVLRAKGIINDSQRFYKFGKAILMFEERKINGEVKIVLKAGYGTLRTNVNTCEPENFKRDFSDRYFASMKGALRQAYRENKK